MQGATHYYGTLRIGDEEVTITRELSASDAKKLNKENRERGDLDFRWSPGDSCSQFFDRESLIEAALRTITEQYPQVTWLFEGNHCVVDPQPVLMGDEPLKTELNKLVAEAEANGWWGGDEEVMEDISDRWQAALSWS